MQSGHAEGSNLLSCTLASETNLNAGLLTLKDPNQLQPMQLH